MQDSFEETENCAQILPAVQSNVRIALDEAPARPIGLYVSARGLEKPSGDAVISQGFCGPAHRQYSVVDLNRASPY